MDAAAKFSGLHVMNKIDIYIPVMSVVFIKIYGYRCADDVNP